MNDIFNIFLIRINIFRFLIKEKLLELRLVNKFWRFFIDDFLFHDYEFDWIRYLSDLKKLPEESKDAHNVYGCDTICRWTGIKFSLKVRGGILFIKMEHAFSNSVSKIITWRVSDSETCNGIEKLKSIFIPGLLTFDKRCHHLMYCETADHNILTMLPIVIDYTNLDDIRFHKLGRWSQFIVHKDLFQLEQISELFFMKSFDVLIQNQDSFLIQQGDNFFKATFLRDYYSQIVFQYMNVLNHHLVSIVDRNIITKIHCQKYGIFFDDKNQILHLYDFSLKSNQPIMTIPHQKIGKRDSFSYYVTSIDLSFNHILIFFGLKNSNHQKLCEFCYLIINVDTKEHKFFQRKEQWSFIHHSRIEQKTNNIVLVHTFFGGTTTKFDLLRLCEINE